MQQNEIQFPVRDKKLICLLKLLEDKKEITKKDLRKNNNSNFTCSIDTALNIFSLELSIYLQKSQIEMEKGFELVKFGTKKDTYKKIKTMTKTNYTVNFISAEFAVITIKNE